MSQFLVERPPWSSLSVDVTNVQSIVDALRMANANFRTEITPAWILDTAGEARGVNGDSFKKVSGENFIRRQDNKVILGRCGKRWRPLQNIDAFTPFQPLVDDGQVSLDRIGMLSGGRKTWMLVKINRPPLVVTSGDEVQKYFLVINGHDGASSITLAYTPIRVWCANMFPRLKQDSKTNLVRVCHGKQEGVKVKLLQAYQALSYADQEFSHIEEELQRLVAIQMPGNIAKGYFMKALRLGTKDGIIPTGKSKTILNRLVELFETGYGNSEPLVRGTLYAAYNAVTQYLNYERGRSDNSRITSLWFGPNAAASRHAYELALKLAV